MSGWLKLHRSMLEWEWIDDHNTTRLFMFMLLKANHKTTRWRGSVIQPGQLVSGRVQLSELTGLTERQVRTSLKRLKTTSEVTSKSYSKYSIFTITNWDKYQANDQQNDQQVTSKRPASDHIQEVKNERSKENTTTGATPEFEKIPENLAQHCRHIPPEKQQYEFEQFCLHNAGRRYTAAQTLKHWRTWDTQYNNIARSKPVNNRNSDARGDAAIERVLRRHQQTVN